MPDAAEPQPGPGALLRRNPAFRNLAAARLISFVGCSLSLVALLLHVATSTGQALAAAPCCWWATSPRPCSGRCRGRRPTGSTGAG